MAISRVGLDIDTGTGISVSFTHGLTILAGDVVSVVVNANLETNDITDNNGANSFTRDLHETYSSARVAIFSRVAGGSEPASYDFSLSSSQRYSAILTVRRGINSASIYDVSPIFANLAAGENSSPSAPSITTSNANSLAVMHVGCDTSAVISWSAYTNGFGSEVGVGSVVHASAMVDKQLTAAGAVGVTAATQSSVNYSNDWFAIQFAFNEAAAGDTVTPTDTDYTFGDTITFSTTLTGTIISWTLTDSAANVFTLSGTDTTAVIPARSAALDACLSENSVTFTVGNGTDTATATVNFNPPSGETITTLTSLLGTPSYIDQFTTAAEVGDQITESDARLTLNADGSYAATGDTEFSATTWVTSIDGGELTQVTMNFIGDGVSTGNNRNNINIGNNGISLKIGIGL